MIKSNSISTGMREFLEKEMVNAGIRYFSLYVLGKAKIRAVDRAGNTYFGIITPGVLNDISKERLIMPQLALRNLWDMTDTEIMNLCEVADAESWGDFRYSKWTVERLDPWDDLSRNVKVSNSKAREYYMVDLLGGGIIIYDKVTGEQGVQPLAAFQYEWFLQNGFAIPMMPEGHTLIEMGLAVDAATIEK